MRNVVQFPLRKAIADPFDRAIHEIRQSQYMSGATTHRNEISSFELRFRIRHAHDEAIAAYESATGRKFHEPKEFR